MKKTILTLLLLIACSLAHSQGGVSLSAHQDARLLFAGDDKGNAAGTLDLLFRLKMQGNQFKHGYIVVFPEVEIADLSITYRRYSANVGYTFNRLVLNNFEASATAGYGWIDRDGMTTFSFGATAELAYKFGSARASIIWQLIERSDLGMIYGKTEARASVLFGIEVDIF